MAEIAGDLVIRPQELQTILGYIDTIPTAYGKNLISLIEQVNANRVSEAQMQVAVKEVKELSEEGGPEASTEAPTKVSRRK